MQKLVSGTYVAKWGDFVATVRGSDRHMNWWFMLKLPHGNGDLVVDASGGFQTPEAAITALSKCLLENGCYALVSGQKMAVADFLRFEDVTDTGDI
jgi:hypothetical protein